MSKRRQPGEVVVRIKGGFVGAKYPRYVKLCEPLDESPDPCCLDCGDPDCIGWDDAEIMHGHHKGQYIYHISECEMADLTFADRMYLRAEETP